MATHVKESLPGPLRNRSWGGRLNERRRAGRRTGRTKGRRPLRLRPRPVRGGTASTWELGRAVLGHASRAAPQSPARAAASSDFWTFRPARDTFRADALLDLRQTERDDRRPERLPRAFSTKNSFVRGDGAICFWAVNFDPAVGVSAQSWRTRPSSWPSVA